MSQSNAVSAIISVFLSAAGSLSRTVFLVEGMFYGSPLFDQSEDMCWKVTVTSFICPALIKLINKDFPRIAGTRCCRTEDKTKQLLDHTKPLNLGIRPVRLIIRQSYGGEHAGKSLRIDNYCLSSARANFFELTSHQVSNYICTHNMGCEMWFSANSLSKTVLIDNHYYPMAQSGSEHGCEYTVNLEF